MRLLVLVSASILLVGCAQAHSAPSVTPLATNVVATCATPAPLIVIDGVLQPSTCDNASPGQRCEPDGPLIYIDGVLICGKQ